MNSLGISVINVGNYIIALNTNNNLLKEKFKQWAKGWINNNLGIEDQTKYDLEVKNELIESEKLLKKSTDKKMVSYDDALNINVIIITLVFILIRKTNGN